MFLDPLFTLVVSGKLRIISIPSPDLVGLRLLKYKLSTAMVECNKMLIFRDSPKLGYRVTTIFTNLGKFADHPFSSSTVGLFPQIERAMSILA